MKKRMLFAAAAAILVPVAMSAGPMKAGKWQVTIEGPGGSHTIERCVTAEEAEKPPRPPKMKDESCKVEDMKVEKNSVSWKLSCPSTGAKAEGKTTYDGDTFNGETHFTMNGHEMVQHTTGKYLGACDK
jgi:hypothetical protein